MPTSPVYNTKVFLGANLENRSRPMVYSLEGDGYTCVYWIENGQLGYMDLDNAPEWGFVENLDLEEWFLPLLQAVDKHFGSNFVEIHSVILAPDAEYVRKQGINGEGQ